MKTNHKGFEDLMNNDINQVITKLRHEFKEGDNKLMKAIESDVAQRQCGE